MLTERQIAVSWRRLFANGEISDEVIAKAESLLDGLRPESPLRHRLQTELDELRATKYQKQD